MSINNFYVLGLTEKQYVEFINFLKNDKIAINEMFSMRREGFEFNSHLLFRKATKKSEQTVLDIPTTKPNKKTKS